MTKCCSLFSPSCSEVLSSSFWCFFPVFFVMSGSLPLNSTRHLMWMCSCLHLDVLQAGSLCVDAYPVVSVGKNENKREVKSKMLA